MKYTVNGGQKTARKERIQKFYEVNYNIYYIWYTRTLEIAKFKLLQEILKEEVNILEWFLPSFVGENEIKNIGKEKIDEFKRFSNTLLTNGSVLFLVNHPVCMKNIFLRVRVWK